MIGPAALAMRLRKLQRECDEVAGLVEDYAYQGEDPDRGADGDARWMFGWSSRLSEMAERWERVGKSQAGGT